MVGGIVYLLAVIGELAAVGELVYTITLVAVGELIVVDTQMLSML